MSTTLLDVDYSTRCRLLYSMSTRFRGNATASSSSRTPRHPRPIKLMRWPDLGTLELSLLFTKNPRSSSYLFLAIPRVDLGAPRASSSSDRRPHSAIFRGMCKLFLKIRFPSFHRLFPSFFFLKASMKLPKPRTTDLECRLWVWLHKLPLHISGFFKLSFS